MFAIRLFMAHCHFERGWHLASGVCLNLLPECLSDGTCLICFSGRRLVKFLFAVALFVGLYIGRIGAFGALGEFKFNLLTAFERFVAVD